ncbi:MAG: XRE family transcriptional regulator, partial [Butyrivibrio sp.]|nr:XRE family transcriptional regulator [Butyrivibrio sp.]
LKRLCSEKHTVAERVINAADIDRTYGHQIFNGTRNPSRDKVIQLAFGFGLNVEETQGLLRAAGKSALYPRIKRDAAIIFAISKKMPLTETQIFLTSLDIAIIGE